MRAAGRSRLHTGHNGGTSQPFHAPPTLSEPREQPSDSPAAGPLQHVIDGCVLSLLFVAPLLMGGRHPLGYFTWMLIAAVLGIATVLHYRSAKPTPGDYVWLAAAVLVALQLVPLPADLLTWLNPGLAELLPALADSSKLPFGETIYADRPLSINPHRTRLALGMLLAYGVIFHAVTRHVQTPADVRRLLGWVAAATVAVGALALAQRFAGNGKFLWVYQHISRSASDAVKGPFQNQNHLAHLMALGLGPLLYFATRRDGNVRTHLAVGGATLCLLAGLLTFSRGGLIAIAAAALLAIGGLAYAGGVNRQRWIQLLLPALLSITLLGIWGGDRLLTQVETLTGTSSLATSAASRLELWKSHVRAITASPWVGYGAATHEDIYPAFIEKDFGVKFTHGESGYLPIQLENGVIGSILLLAALGLIAGWSFRCVRIYVGFAAATPADSRRGQGRGKRDRAERSHQQISRSDAAALTIACLAGVAASAVQSIADFVWYIPACLTPTLMLVASLYRLSMATHEPRDPAPQPHGSAPRRTAFSLPWLAAPVAVLVVALTWAAGPAQAEPDWHRFRMLARESSHQSAEHADIASTLNQRISLLDSVIRHNPCDAAPRFRLASTLMSGTDRLALADDALKNKLLSAAARHTIIGLQRAPVSGEGYLLLADLYRRAGRDSDAQLVLLEQAVRVRENDAETGLRAGLSAIRGNNITWGLETWKPYMQTPSEERDKILHELSQLLPIEIILHSFPLDHTALTILYDHQRQSGGTDTAVARQLGDQLVASLVQAADSANSPTEAAALIFRASYVSEQTSDSVGRAADLASQAVELSAADYRYRVRLLRLLISARRWDEAKEQIRWCQLRNPHDAAIERQQEILLKRMAEEKTAIATKSVPHDDASRK